MSDSQAVTDPLEGDLQPIENVNYATGLMLDARDFRDQQTYHRGRLARVLSYLHGYGTVAGLRVAYTGPRGPDESVFVSPGLALDRFGRLIEVAEEQCIRLDRWFQGHDIDDLVAGLRGSPASHILVDVFIRFELCATQKTPAFASGPFDALNAVVPARIREHHALGLVVRTEEDPVIPTSSWQLGEIGDPGIRRTRVREAILDSWEDAVSPPVAISVVDPHAIFLARLTLPAAAAPAGQRPQRTGAAVSVDNLSRPFVYSSRLVASLLALSSA